MILITGASGQLGTELRYLLDERGISYEATDSKELDITDAAKVQAFFAEKQPTIVYHCAAYTAVDKAEDEGKELDELVNVGGTRNIAEAAEKVGARVFYVSTDYVFDGTRKDGVYRTDDVANPQNEYGRTKYAGEEIIRQVVKDHYIVRTSWVFGNYGHNFVFTMQRLAETHPKLTVVNDQHGRPTWTRTLAEFLVFLNERTPENGTYHLSNEGSCTWYDFAVEILKDRDITIDPVDSTQFPQKAKRPQYSVLDLSKTQALGFTIPTWQEALAGMLAQKKPTL